MTHKTTSPKTPTDPVVEHDVSSVLRLAQHLIQSPSQGGIDSPDPVLTVLGDWLGAHHLAPYRLHTGNTLVGLACDITGTHPGPRYVLNACIDTAPFGNEAAWEHPPTSGTIEDGRLYGRGSADSKTAAAIFAHIGIRLHAVRENLHGTLTLLFDADEHTGNFGGAKTFFGGPGAHTDGVMIGYPGSEHLVVGCRGVVRARISVHGHAGHTGSRHVTPNAITKAAEIIQRLSRTVLPPTQTAFPQPRLTVTGCHGGDGPSITPDRCNIAVDIRLTPDFDSTHAHAILARTTAAIDETWPDTPPTGIIPTLDWPPYNIPEDDPLTRAILDAARTHNLTVTPKIAGPSSIGNYLAGIGIPATAGFGLEYQHLHATNENISITSIAPTQTVYQTALRSLLMISDVCYER